MHPKQILDQICDGIEDAPPPIPLMEWARKYLPHMLYLDPSELHIHIASECDRMNTERGSRVLIEAPRGNAKTTIVQAYVLMCICEGLEPYIVVTEETGPQAIEFLETVKDELTGNLEIAQDYPEVFGEGKIWQAQRIITRNNIQVVAAGSGFAMRGRKKGAARPTLVITDDPEGEKHRDSPTQREKSWKWFTGTLLNIGYTDRTNYIVTGTVLHRDCLVERLLKAPGWRSRKFRSIEGFPRKMNMVLWKEWENLFLTEQGDEPNVSRAFYEFNKSKMDKGATVLWPELESLLELMELRSTIGHHSFALEKQSEPISPDAVEWPAEYFDDSIWFDEWPPAEKMDALVMALDPAKGKDARKGAYPAIIMAGVWQGKIYVEANMERRPVEEIVDTMIELARAKRYHVIGVEDVQFQELLVDVIAEKGEQITGLHLPVIGIPTEGINKLVRIRRIGPYLMRRTFRFKTKSPATEMLIEHLKDFPLGAYFDGPDALEMALRLIVACLEGDDVDDELGEMEFLPVGIQ